MPATSTEFGLSLRERLMLSPDDRIIYAPGPSTREAAHEDVVWVGSILHLIDPRYKIIIWGRGARVDRVVRRAAALNQPRTLLIAERRLGGRIEEELLLPVADALLVLNRGLQPTEILEQARMRGIPVVALARPGGGAEETKSGSHVHFVRRFSPPVIAEQILRLFDAALPRD